jgi:SAM-dependent methyltransferase
MLDKARQNAGERGVELRLLRTSLEDLDIEGEFDAAFSVFTTLNYVLDEAKLSAALARLRSLLRPGGVLVVDSGNFAAAFGNWKRVTTKTSRGKGWSVRTHTSHRLDVVNMLWYHTDTTRMKLGHKVKEWRETRVLRMWTFPELRTQLLANGFSKIRLFGQMKAGAREAKNQARRLVIVTNR